ncbi:hypothetical protein EES44_18300 [Streptomyces sp. ADI96-15]|nr:hypothetical protein EES44_18300 [Streptomyces sp. ADI96-15]
MRGQRLRRGVVEHGAAPHGQPRAHRENPAELLDHDGVETEVLEGERRVDRGRVPHDDGRLLAHERAQGRRPLRSGEPAQRGDGLTSGMRGANGGCRGRAGLRGGRWLRRGPRLRDGPFRSRLQPEAAALEGVGRQVDASDTAQQRGPVDIGARHPQRRQRPMRYAVFREQLDEGGRDVVVVRRGRGGASRVRIVRGGRGGESRVRSSLHDERQVAVPHQRRGVIGGRVRLPRLPQPVLKVLEQLRLRRPAQHRRHHGQPGGAGLDRGQHPAVGLRPIGR